MFAHFPSDDTPEFLSVNKTGSPFPFGAILMIYRNIMNFSENYVKFHNWSVCNLSPENFTRTNNFDKLWLLALYVIISVNKDR